MEGGGATTAGDLVNPGAVCDHDDDAHNQDDDQLMMIIVMMTIMMMMTQVYVGSPSWRGC